MELQLLAATVKRHVAKKTGEMYPALSRCRNPLDVWSSNRLIVGYIDLTNKAFVRDRKLKRHVAKKTGECTSPSSRRVPFPVYIINPAHGIFMRMPLMEAFQLLAV
jgi:hypothetical protein